MKRQSKSRREVRDGDGWQRVLRSKIVVSGVGRCQPGWLHYELRDGTNGLAQPKNWRGDGKQESTNEGECK